MIYQVVVPSLGATGREITIAEWFVKPNDFVKSGSPVFAVTTDKADMEVEAYRDGYIREILVAAGTPVTPGTVVAVMADTSEEALVDSSSSAKTETGSFPTIPRGDLESMTVLSERTESQTPRQPDHSAGKRIRSLVSGEGQGPHRDSAKTVPQQSDSSATTGSPALTVDLLLETFRRTVLIRRFEDSFYNLFLQGRVTGTLHQCQGQEAVAVGVCSALGDDDVIFSTHRPVGRFIATGH